MPQAPFKANKRTRERVMRLVATGMGKRAIAEALGIAKSTVEIHFAHELEVGRAKMQAALTELLWTAANNGNVAAIRRLEERASGDVMDLKLKAIGKKEQQLEAAKNAGGDEWGDLLKVEPTQPLPEGYVRKGGQNPAPENFTRPPPPAPFKPN